jgi:hypothetical protein
VPLAFPEAFCGLIEDAPQLAVALWTAVTVVHSRTFLQWAQLVAITVLLLALSVCLRLRGGEESYAEGATVRTAASTPPSEPRQSIIVGQASHSGH